MIVNSTDSQNLLHDAGCSNPMLCDILKGWDGVGGGKKAQEGGNICMPMSDPC